MGPAFLQRDACGAGLLGSSWSYCCWCCPVEHSQVPVFLFAAGCFLGSAFFSKGSSCDLFYKTSFCFPPAPMCSSFAEACFPEAASQQALPCMWPLVCLAALSWQVHLFQRIPWLLLMPLLQRLPCLLLLFLFQKAPTLSLLLLLPLFQGLPWLLLLSLFQRVLVLAWLQTASFSEAGLAWLLLLFASTLAPFSGASTFFGSSASFTEASNFAS